MSATGRSDVRDADDYYRTPEWATRAMLKKICSPTVLGGLKALDPGCGDGAILHELPSTAIGIELDTERAERARSGLGQLVFNDDFFTWAKNQPDHSFDIAIGNPPYGQALMFVQESIRLAPLVVMLLRINWLASQKRAKWMREHTPSVYVLPKRPSFTNGGTDATDYAWMAWGLDGLPRVVILDVEPHL